MSPYATRTVRDNPGCLFNEAVLAIAKVNAADTPPLDVVRHLVMLRNEIDLRLGLMVDYKPNQGLTLKEPT